MKSAKSINYKGAPARVSAVLDITKRKMNEEQLRIFSSLFELASDAIFVSDLDGRIIYFNEVTHKQVGYSREEMAKLTLFEFCSPEAAKLVKSRIKKILETHTAVFESEHMRKDKTVFPVEVSSRVIDSGGVKLVLNVARDISERKKAEEALLERERLYRTLFENSQDGFQLVKIIYNETRQPIDLITLNVNNAFEKQTGVKAADVVGQSIRKSLPNAEPYIFELPDYVAKTGKTIHSENYSQDTKRYFNVYYFPYPYAENTVGVLFRDVTLRKSLEKQIQEKDRFAAIGATAGMIGHDIRNPLQAIVSELYLAKQELNEVPPNENTKATLESLESIESNVFYINKIVADLQDYGRQVTPVFKEVNIESLVKEALHSIILPSNIVTSYYIEDNAKWISTDPDLLKRILNNLEINAIQAMPKGGKIFVHVFRKNNQVVITIEDTGEGIPEEVKFKLFTPMFTTKAQGQGLGLAVVKRLVEAQGGTVSFESQVGRGTKFIIELPAVEL